MFFDTLLGAYERLGESGTIKKKPVFLGEVVSAATAKRINMGVIKSNIMPADEPEPEDTQSAFPFINPSESITSLGDGFPWRNMIERTDRHNGVDLRMYVGTELKAVKAGTIEIAEQLYTSPGSGIVNGAGLAVLLRIDPTQIGLDGIRYVWYFHLSSLSIPRAGDTVSQGDIIGYSGGCAWLGSDGVASRHNSECKMCESNGALEYVENGPFAHLSYLACTDVHGNTAHGNMTSGNSTGAHLHYEMKTQRVGGYVDPAPHLTYSQMPA